MRDWRNFALAMLGAVIVYDEIKLINNRRKFGEFAEVLENAATIMQDDEKTISYFISLMNKHKPDLDEFDYIALKELHIEFKD